MIPSVFVSSTISGLQPIRDTVRSVVEDLGYRPVMSEWREVNYMSGSTAEASCYKSIGECQIVVLIIGKHYGSASSVDPDKSVTEMEFEEALNGSARIITLVDAEVYQFKKVYDANKTKECIEYPEMNNPEKTFAFISRVNSATTRNAIIPFTTTTDIRQILKSQFATMVYDLLCPHDPKADATLKDILSEVRTLREAMTKSAKPDVKYLAATRFLLEDRNANFVSLLKHIFGGAIEVVIATMTEADDFSGFIAAHGMHVEIDPKLGEKGWEFPSKEFHYFGSFCPLSYLVTPGGRVMTAYYAWDEKERIVLNQVAFDYYTQTFFELKRMVAQAERVSMANGGDAIPTT